MAPSASSRPVRKSSTSSRRGRAARKEPAEDRSSSSSSDGDREAPDVARIRQKRTTYYDKPPAERSRHAKPLTQVRGRRAAVDGLRRTKTTGSTTSVHLVGSSRTSVKYRQRRKREPKEAGQGGDYVYRTVSAPTRLPPISERPSTSRKLSVELPRSALSLGKTRRIDEDSTKRRHSYNGEARRRPVREVSDSSRVERTIPKRSISMREPTRASSSKDTVSRSQSTRTRRVRPSLAPLPIVAEERKPEPPRAQRPASVFGSIFGPARSIAPEPKVTCLTCMDDMPLSRTAKLDCGHRMCRNCLKRIFTMSVTDPAHMPPRCCTSDCIPLKHVDRIFDHKFKMKWNRKYQEYTTKNRIYCPSRGCGAWIPPKDIRVDPRVPSRRYGKCARCRTKVCATCNNKWHASRKCPNDESTQRFAEMAKEQGWQRCFNCKATVELKEGCNHMTCRCTAQFCMICGSKWKTCDCPWFNYASLGGADRLEHMNVAEVRRIAAEDPAVLRAPRGYAEEQERRREQERRDESLARRMQGIDLDRHFDDAAAVRMVNRRSRLGRASDDPAEHYEDPEPATSANFLQRAATLLMSPISREHEEEADRLVAEARARRRARVAAREQMGEGTPAPGTPTGTSTPSRRSTTRNNDAAIGAEPSREVLIPRRTSAAWEAPLAPAARAIAPEMQPRESTTEGSSSRRQGRGQSKGKERYDESGSAGDTNGDRSRSKPAASSSVAVKSKPERRNSVRNTTTTKTKDKKATVKDILDDGAPDPTAATLAGLRRKSTLGRVDAWRRHIAPGAEDASEEGEVAS